jgi:hypothetical protein
MSRAENSADLTLVEESGIPDVSAYVNDPEGHEFYVCDLELLEQRVSMASLEIPGIQANISITRRVNGTTQFVDPATLKPEIQHVLRAKCEAVARLASDFGALLKFVRFLETKNKKLKAEIERLKST